VTVRLFFPPEAARSLFKTFLQAISGGLLYRQVSFLLNSLHQPVFSHCINIIESPLLPKALGSAPFDQEGVATFNKTLIEQGVLKTYLLDTYAAKRLNMVSTGNAGGARNVEIITTGLNFAELLRVYPQALLVTELMGQGINMVTGDYSRGAFGFWIENGEIQYPVNEITIAGNLNKMFKQIQAVGNDTDRRSSVATGSVLLENMTIAGN